jgi:hypothetical protein
VIGGRPTACVQTDIEPEFSAWALKSTYSTSFRVGYIRAPACRRQQEMILHRACSYHPGPELLEGCIVDGDGGQSRTMSFRRNLLPGWGITWAVDL